jgi:hypothetical protein
MPAHDWLKPCSCYDCIHDRPNDKSCSECRRLYQRKYMVFLGPDSNYKSACNNCYIASQNATPIWLRSTSRKYDIKETIPPDEPYTTSDCA